MISPLSFNPALGGVASPASPSIAATGAPGNFQELLLQALETTKDLNAESQANVQQSLLGDELSMVETFTAMREADLALKLTMQIRNKLVDAYNEIQQMRF
ncbi:MAG TPA: flagellar hook-basal body complex protein FliE [Planctomycetaceae bacterium]|nr:flagellar hook-basal body complex protein FliE [Planctomycetaceae bacterium]